MKSILHTAFSIALIFQWTIPARAETSDAETSDIFDFFAEEARAMMMTASRLPLSVRQSPATVHTITGDDLRSMGVQTLWDALRTVPGVEVVASRTAYAEVSIRGLNKVFANRTLVQLDGRTVLNGPFDTVFWEGIPVALEEIDRIEVVLGSASALYGANAVNGVINIITQTPAQLKGGTATYTVGEQHTHRGAFVYGKQYENARFKVGLDGRATSRFGDGSLRASDVKRGHLLAGWTFSDRAALDVSGGLADYETQFSAGLVGVGIMRGKTGFLRAESVFGATQMRGFWNYERPEMIGLSKETFVLKTDLIGIQFTHRLPSFWRNQLVVGSSYRQTRFASAVAQTQKFVQHLWGLFFENAWHPISPFTRAWWMRTGSSMAALGMDFLVGWMGLR